MQLDEHYLDAVRYLKEQFGQLQLTDEQWLDVINDQTELSSTATYVKTAADQFPERDAVMKRFSVEGLRSALEDQAADTSEEIRLSTGEIEVAARQQQVLLDLQRYLARRKQSRVVRLVNAAHRRAILTHPQGPINRQLSLAAEELLTRSR